MQIIYKLFISLTFFIVFPVALKASTISFYDFADDQGRSLYGGRLQESSDINAFIQDYIDPLPSDTKKLITRVTINYITDEHTSILCKAFLKSFPYLRVLDLRTAQVTYQSLKNFLPFINSKNFGFIILSSVFDQGLLATAVEVTRRSHHEVYGMHGNVYIARYEYIKWGFD